MPNLLFGSFSRSRILLISPLQPTVYPPDFFLHGSGIRPKPQQSPGYLHRTRRKIRRHVLLRLVEKPPPICARRFRNRNLNQIIIIPDFLNRLRRASPLNSSRGQSSLQVAPASLPASDDEKSHQKQRTRADYETKNHRRIDSTLRPQTRPLPSLALARCRQGRRRYLIRPLRIVHIDELSIHHVVLALARRPARALRSTSRAVSRLPATAARSSRSSSSLLRFIEHLSHLMRSLGQAFHRSIDAFHISITNRAASFLDRSLDRLRIRLGQLVAIFLQQLFRLVDKIVSPVASLRFQNSLLIFIRMRLSFLAHALRFILTQAGRSSNRDLLFLASSLVFRRNIEQAVRVNIERNLNLRQAARRRRKTHKLEIPKAAIPASHRSFPLQNMNVHRGLIISRGRKCFRLARRNRSVPGNQGSHHATERLDAQRKRRHVQQQDVLHFPAKHATLNSRPHRNDFIRINALMPFLAEQFLHNVLNQRHASLAADQNHFIDLAGVHSRVLHALFARFDRPANDFVHHRFQFRPREFLHQVLRTGSIGGNERQIDLRLHGCRKLNLGPLSRIAQPLQSHLVALGMQIEPFVLLEFLDEPIDDSLIQVVAAQVRVAVGSFHFYDAFTNFQNRNVKSAAAKVINGDGFVFLLVQAVSKRRRSRLVDDALHV